MKQAITDIPLDEMPKLVAELGLAPYAADQIIGWLYKKRVDSFEAMTNLPRRARDLLLARFAIEAVRLDALRTAADGTKKFLCRAYDAAAVEAVLIPACPPGEGRGEEDARMTVCLSAQAGCAMGCAFCRTGGMGLHRNLTAGEILGQLVVAMRHAPSAVTNVVLMGMGEPLANREALGRAVEALLDERAFGFSRRRVTLSTCGLLPELEEFAKAFDIKIAISLNATTDEVRDRLMPINKRYPIAKIMEFCRGYSKDARHRVTFEYVLIRGVNDARDDARRLVGLLEGVRAKVNLIPFNPFPGCDFEAPPPETVEWWREFLYTKGVQAGVRMSRGGEILAACGQLAASLAP